MSYEKQTWNKYDDLKTEEENIENGAVVTDNRMNHIEEGIYSHTIDISNPHKVTAAQVGLDKVDNVKQASKVEFDSHTSDNSNPHKVTAAQIGLDKVDNIQQAAKTDFDSHVNNKANPHSVTASQVGTYTKQEIDTKLSKTVMTDDSGKVTIKDLVVTGTIQQTLSVNQSIAVGWGRTLNFTRIGNVVTVTAEGTFGTTMPQGAWQSAGETLPVGFRPLSRQTTRASAITNVNKFMWTRFNTDGSIQHWQNGSIAVTDTIIMNGTSWVTTDPFPT
ncbi:hypothetical protein [Lactococcus lactis]|jgi:hypothetical protein|uniref:Uncharacterized protein n=1 Tax=Lactococcus lactis subsp. lactis TaxID=1360 RepID=A0A1V0P3G6_LACLL|nr:hypothetical protein [Lactococcus lactis]MDN6254210.1 hypothetical protein [Tetragenococcus koreensis]ARE21230.1 hypothetical protein LLUC06_1687 [Lactococcus lactis subsp. lactis]MDH8062529.1 hypothetical protein [Lactococcus lactis subsp. lactis]MDN5615301.1 hypothetical protein [Lactococcus lactis]MDN6011890.1 hypothetical protein [Lactococcus lactis]